MADHDYGCNNADSTFEFRHESAVAYVDYFLKEPFQSAMNQRAQVGHGVYGVKVFDFARSFGDYKVPENEAGIDPDVVLPLLPVVPAYSNMSVAVFVLDVRSHKTPWKTGTAAYQPDLEGDFLGERQWHWFETAIRRSRASINVVVNGLQVHASRYPDGNVAEAWSKYPRAQQRLYDALLQDGVEAPILVSGDVHMTQLMRKDCARRGQYEQPTRAVVEFTTSGMTHSWGTLSSPPLSDPDHEPSWRQRYQSFVSSHMLTLLHHLCPWTDLMYADSNDVDRGLLENGGGEGSSSGLQYSLAKNFGEMEFDFESRTVAIRAMGETADANPLLMASFSMDQLSGRSVLLGSKLQVDDFRSVDRVRNVTVPDADWVCVNHRGQDYAVHHAFGHLLTGLVLMVFTPAPLALPAVTCLLLIRWVRVSRKRCTSHGTAQDN